MKKISVLYISHESGASGAPKSLVEMINGLKNEVNPIVVIPRKGKLEEVLVKEGINYIIVPFSVALHKKGFEEDVKMRAAMKSNILAAYQVAEYIKDKDIDLIHSNSSVVDVGMITAIICNKPHIWHFREYVEELFSASYYDKDLKKQLFECSDANISITRALGRTYKDKYGIQSVSLYNGIASKKYEKTHDNCIKGNNLQINLLFAGSVSVEKGQFEAVKAVEYLLCNYEYNIKLLIVGNGAAEYIELLKIYVVQKHLQENVEIMSYVDDLMQLRQESDFALVCTKYEALGRVTIEAMFAELPVIGADTGGTKELIGENEERGYLYKQGDYIALADSIRRAIEDKDGTERRRIVAKEFALREFDLTRYADKIMELYHRAVDSFDGTKITHKKAILEKLVASYGRDKNNKDNSLPLYVGNLQARKVLIDEFVNKWKEQEEKGKTVSRYLEEKGYQSVAIYGLGVLGRKLMKEILLESNLKLRYIIDKTPKSLGDFLPQFTLEDTLPQVDAVIITVLGEESLIKNKLIEKIEADVYALKELVNELFY